jgi:hypothetical protein
VIKINGLDVSIKVRNWEDMELKYVENKIFSHRTPMALPFGFYLATLVCFSLVEMFLRGFFRLPQNSSVTSTWMML